MPTPTELLQIAASATYREMTKRDFMAFSGAPAGTLIADEHPDVLVLFTPAAASCDGDGDYFEMHGVDAEGAPWCKSLTITDL